MRNQEYDRNHMPHVTERRRQEIFALRSKGRKVIEITPYQYRIDDTIDLYPTSSKFHNIKTGDRGKYPAWIPKDLMEIYSLKNQK